LFAIGRLYVLSLTKWSSQIHADFHGSGATREHGAETECLSCTGLLPAAARRSRSLPLGISLVTPWQIWCSASPVPQPPTGNATRLIHQSGLGSSRFARRYSGSRICFLFLRVLRCFSSPGSLYPPYFVQAGVTPHDGCRVSPFGYPRINARSAAPRGFSQPPTSFIGFRRQGIHRWLFIAWRTKMLVLAMEFSKGVRSAQRHCRREEAPPQRPGSKGLGGAFA
jgi:hypothetical protein